jgi:TorA maturation chaperone TorD
MEQNKLSANQARAVIYRLLGACYYQPEAAFSEEDVFGQLREALAVLDDSLAEQAVRLGRAFAAESLDELLLDYSRLFLGPFNILAKPYGSIYLEGEKVVMGDSTMDALACYRQEDFVLSEDFREVPDHIAAELEFLYLLTFRENEALASGEKNRRDALAALKTTFLQNHLGRWVPPFAAALRQGAATDFYRLLAELTEGFIRKQSPRLAQG